VLLPDQWLSENKESGLFIRRVSPLGGKKRSMALVVFLKGVNVGGHRTFRSSAVAMRLKRLGAINIGAAGTFIIRKPVGRVQLRMAIQRLIPFDVVIIICEGRATSSIW
jgi:hypothetical protein